MEQITRQDATSRLMMWFWWGLVIYNIGFSLAVLELPLVYHLGAFVGIPLAMFGLWRSVNLHRPMGDKSGYTLCLMLVGWVLFMWLKSDADKLFSPLEYIYTYNALPYLGIFFMAVPTVSLVRSFFNFAYKTYRWYLVLFIVPMINIWNYGLNQNVVETFMLAAAVIYMTNKYHSSRTLVFAVVCLILAFLICTLTARRNMMLTLALYMMIGSFSYVFGNKIKSLENRIVIISCACIFMLLSLYVFMADSTGAFSLITQRASENTRDGVLMGFMLDMDSMSDWLYGRGIFGTYYCPGFDADVTEEYRNSIECGYLQWILKGGCIYLLLYLVTIITAMVKGFRAHNQLCKASAWILVVQLIDMIVFGLHAFNTKTFVIWMAVAICFSRELRQQDDQGISNLCFEQPLIPMPWQKN